MGAGEGVAGAVSFEDWIRVASATFPRLTVRNCRPTSPVDENYNCIAWAVGDQEHWWWPDPLFLNYWPPEVPREESLQAFERALGLAGYVERSDARVDVGKEKVAIYASSSGMPTHAARQVADGWWASKLGENIDIEHQLEALDGPEYGRIALVLARPSRL